MSGIGPMPAGDSVPGDATRGSGWRPGPLPTEPPHPRRRTLSLRVELGRQLGRIRTRAVLIILAVLPIVIWLAFVIGSATAPASGQTQGGASATADLATRAQDSGANFVAFTLFLTAGFLLTIVIALFFGDMIAGEATWSTLKYLLTIPVPRSRLFVQKALVAALLSLAGIVALVVVATVVGVLAYGTGPLQFRPGPAIPLADALPRLVAATALVCAQLLWAASLGALLSVVTDSPLGAAGGVVLATIVSTILDQVTTLGDLRVLLPTHYSAAYRQLLGTSIDWDQVAACVLSALIYGLVLTALALRRFTRKDITG